MPRPRNGQWHDPLASASASGSHDNDGRPGAVVGSVTALRATRQHRPWSPGGFLRARASRRAGLLATGLLAVSAASTLAVDPFRSDDRAWTVAAVMTPAPWPPPSPPDDDVCGEDRQEVLPWDDALPPPAPPDVVVEEGTLALAMRGVIWFADQEGTRPIARYTRTRAVADILALLDVTADREHIVVLGGHVSHGSAARNCHDILLVSGSGDVSRIARLPAGSILRGVALSKDGRRLAHAFSLVTQGTPATGSTLVLWDLDTARPVEEWTTDCEAAGIALNGRGDAVATACQEGPRVYREGGDATAVALPPGFLGQEAIGWADESAMVRTASVEATGLYIIDSPPDGGSPRPPAHVVEDIDWLPSIGVFEFDDTDVEPGLLAFSLGPDPEVDVWLAWVVPLPDRRPRLLDPGSDGGISVRWTSGGPGLTYSRAGDVHWVTPDGDDREVARLGGVAEGASWLWCPEE
jgi:hypothetical protein